MQLIPKLTVNPRKMNSNTHEPQPEPLRTDILYLGFQQILGGSKNLLRSGDSAGQRTSPALHLKLHVLQLQRYRFTLENG